MLSNEFFSFTRSFLYYLFFKFSGVILISFDVVVLYEAQRNLGRERDPERVGIAFGNPLGLDLRLPGMLLKVYSL